MKNKNIENIFLNKDISKYYEENKEKNKLVIKKENDKVIFTWKNHNCYIIPPPEYFEENILSVFNTLFKESIVNKIVFSLYELLTNAFRSNFDFRMREHLNCEIYKNEKYNLNIHANCENCTNVSLEIYLSDNKLHFFVKNYNRLHQESLDRINKIMESDEITGFPNSILCDYSSYTGNTGVGIYTINKILKENYKSQLNFSHEENIIAFYFNINIDLLK